MGIVTGRKEYIKKGYTGAWNRKTAYNLNSAHKGSHYNVGEDHPFFGKHHTEMAKNRVGEANFKGGKPRCPICGKVLHYSTKYCNRHAVAGERSYNWKGGITPLGARIRNLHEYQQWRLKVFQRDNWTCQDCRARSQKGKAVVLNAHHTPKSFANILAEFLQEYNQFSPYDDKDTLVRLATKYEPFWDVDGGKTLCDECHYKRKGGIDVKRHISVCE